jgi:hypothetical protein
MHKPSQAFIDFHVKTVQARACLSEMKQHLASWNAFNEAAIIRLALTKKLKNEEADRAETVALASTHISGS